MTYVAGNTDRVSRRTLAAGAFAVAVVALGYGIVLPLIPVMLNQLIPTPSPSDIAWHTSLLTGAFAIAPLIAAAPWGVLSDRYGRQPVLVIGLLGFSVTFGATAFPTSLVAFYAARLLNGAFAAAVFPTVLASVTDLGRDESWRGRAFALVSAASSVGLLAGPILGGLAADLPPLPYDFGAVPSWRVLAFLSVAVLALAAAATFVLIKPNGGESRSSLRHAPERKLSQVARLAFVLLAAVVAAGLGLFEVGLTLQSRVLAMSSSALGLMFAGCMVVMLLVQTLAFSPLARPARTQWFISPAFLLLGFGLTLILWSPGNSGLVLATAGVAAAGGFLSPALAYWLSYDSGTRAGVHLGLESAAVSIGQTLGSTTAVLLIGNSVWGAIWLTGLTIGSAAAALALSLYLSRSGKAVAAQIAQRR